MKAWAVALVVVLLAAGYWWLFVYFDGARAVEELKAIHARQNLAVNELPSTEGKAFALRNDLAGFRNRLLESRVEGLKQFAGYVGAEIKLIESKEKSLQAGSALAGLNGCDEALIDKAASFAGEATVLQKESLALMQGIDFTQLKGLEGFDSGGLLELIAGSQARMQGIQALKKANC
ncbi:hypothetical protein HZB89_01255 [archaeon]|nr:hypothetical protein [archaeon]